MHACCRFQLIALTAGLLAGCAVGPGGSPSAPAGNPSPAAASSDSPAATSTASLTVLPAPTMFTGCIEVEDIAPASPFFDASASLGHLDVDLQVTRIEERSGGRDSATPPPREMRYDTPGLVLGGREFLIHPLGYYEGYDTPLAMESASFVLSLEGQDPIELATRIVPGNENYDQFAVTAPDVSGIGTLAVELAWTDRCFRLEASGSIRVEVVSRAQAATCEMTEKAYNRGLEELLDRSLAVGPARPPVFSPSNQARYGPFGAIGIDVFLAYLFDPDQPVIASAPGATIRVENHRAALQLGDPMTVWVWTRESVAKAVRDYPPGRLVEVLHREVQQASDGIYALPAPDASGRYVMGLSVGFESTCITGDIWAVVNIDVEG